MNGYNDGMLEGKKLGVSLDTSDGLIPGTDEGVVLLSPDGEVLSSSLGYKVGSELVLDEGT